MASIIKATLSVAALVGFSVGAGCTSSDGRSTEPPADAGAADQADREAPPAPETDAMTDSGTGETSYDCESTFPTTPECTHPPVQPNCANGWCKVPRGCFVMGAPLCEYMRGLYDDEIEVRLSHDFEIQQYELSQTEWTALGLPNPSIYVPQLGSQLDCAEDTCPVGNVSWWAAAAFANRLSQAHSPPLEKCYRLENCQGTLGVEGFRCETVETTTLSIYDCEGYRLPTEAEWEYAARAGTRSPFYLGTYLHPTPPAECEFEPALASAAWYCFDGDGVSHPRGRKQPNAWGLFDMLGNATEWVDDIYWWFGRGEGPLTDPWANTPAPGTDLIERVHRGGSANAQKSACKVSFRLHEEPSASAGGMGFRLARTVR